MQDAKQIVALAERIRGKAIDCANGKTGTVTIGYNGSEGDFLFSLIHCTRKLYPNVNVNPHHESMYELLRCVVDGRVDIAFLYQGPNCSKLDSLQFLPIQKCKMELLVSEKHHLANQQNVRIEELKDEPFVELNRNTFPEFHDTFHQLCQQCGFIPKTVCEDESQAVFSRISMGDGIGYILSGTEHSFGSYPIRAVDIVLDDDTQNWFLGLAWNKKTTNPYIRPVLAVAEQYLKS